MNEQPPRRRRPSTRSAATTRSAASNRRKRGRRFRWLAPAVVAIALFAVLMWSTTRRHTPVEPRFPEVAVGDTPADEPTTGDRSVVLVFPEWDAMGFVSELRQIPSRSHPDEDLLAVMESLCAGPTVSGAISAMPTGTRPLGAFYDRDERGVVLDFSEELVTRHPGGSTSEAATLTSILRTVALNFPEAENCWILVDGAQVETLAGHLALDRPFSPRRWL
jgi:spore germination protein GerM